MSVSSLNLLDADNEDRRIRNEYPTHPIVADMDSKVLAFDAALASYKVPAPAVA